MKAVVLIMLLLAAGNSQADEKHMGVATCASSVCHGSSTERTDGNIFHNEYVTWWQQDPHAGAYRTLLSDTSKRMATRLGIGPAHEAPACLACHSDYLPEAQRGPRFQLSDGVGCESCHGGAEQWLSSHTERDATHQANLDRGMTPLADAAVRAELCSSCHVGDSERFAGHDIMGAGHPRLQFELATYSKYWPSHHRNDERYQQRKPVPDDLTLWSVGQLRNARTVLDGLSGHRFMATPLWPELAYFDCHACHTAMNADKWQPRPAAKLAPGAVRLNDSALLMVGWLFEATSVTHARDWRAKLAALHQASQQNSQQVADASEAMLRVLDDWHANIQRAEGYQLDASRLVNIIRRDALNGAFNDYMTTEQVLMVIALAPGTRKNDPALDKLYDALADQHAFTFREFLQALKSFGGSP